MIYLGVSVIVGMIMGGLVPVSAAEEPMVARVSEDAHQELRNYPRTAEDDIRDIAEDRAAFLRTIDPSRARRPAPAGLDVPALRSIGRNGGRVAPGGEMPLQVQAVPDTPVSFFAPDGGAFTNGANAITVLSDAEGIARTVFHATDDATSVASVQVASPRTQRQVVMTITIE